MAAIRARFIVVNAEVRDGVTDLALRATKQSDKVNTENPILWTDNESSQNELKLRIKTLQAAPIFIKGREVFVDINGPI